jgi:hypothetical protein
MSRAALGCFGPAHDVQDGARKVPVREVQHLGRTRRRGGGWVKEEDQVTIIVA